MVSLSGREKKNRKIYVVRVDEHFTRGGNWQLSRGEKWANPRSHVHHEVKKFPCLCEIRAYIYVVYIWGAHTIDKYMRNTLHEVL